MPEGSAGPEDVVRRGETSPDAIAAKARCVLEVLDGRLGGLGANWDEVTATNIYTEHDVNALLGGGDSAAHRGGRTARGYVALRASADCFHRV